MYSFATVTLMNDFPTFPANHAARLGSGILSENEEM